MNHSDDMKPQELIRHFQTEYGLTEAEATELCRTLEENLRDLRQVLAAGLREADREKVARAGHSLKGLATQSGLAVLTERGAALEAAADAEAEYRAIAGDALRLLGRWLGETESRGIMRTPESKIMTLDQARAWREELRQAGRTLVVTNGCFDILHRGHGSYLARAREQGDALLVAVNSDSSVKALKGPNRPVNSESDRAYLLASLEAVDAVVIFPSLRAAPVLEALQPDIYVKGGDITIATLPVEERDVLQALGAQIVFLPFVTGFSTTGVIQRLQADGKSG